MKCENKQNACFPEGPWSIRIYLFFSIMNVGVVSVYGAVSASNRMGGGGERRAMISTS